MTQSRTVIEIFLSSPDEVQAERDLIAQYAGEWNRLRGREATCHLSLLTWQELVAPALGSRPQQVVNEQIGNDYDVYLAVFWTRIGTSTGIAESGTVEEFELALGRAQQNGRPRIAALFKKAPIDPSTIDPVQLQKVQTFKQRLGDMGAFYREFSDEDSLRNIVNLLFEQLAKEAASADRHAAPLADKPRHTDVAEDDDDLGLIEVGEEFQRLTATLIDRMKDIATEEEKNAETLKECTEETSALTAMGRFDAETAKAIVKKSAKSLKALADYYERSLEELDDLFLEMGRLVRADIRLRLEFDDPMEAAGDNIEAMRDLVQTLATSIAQLDGLIGTTRQLPPMSGELKKARNRLGRSRERLKEMLISLSETVASTVTFFEEQTDKATGPQ